MPSPRANLLVAASVLLAHLGGPLSQAAADEPVTPDPAAAEFFERDVRPLLVEKCQPCHGGKKTGGKSSKKSEA